jgi:hypothetical protein
MPNNGESTASVQTEAPALRNPEVDRVTVRVPPFWSNEPALWFSQLESQLALANVTADTTKFHYVVSNLDFRNAQVVRDILQTPPRSDKYEALKTALISRLSSSEEQRIQQLLQREDLGDRKPSEFLRHLRSLATVPENLLRSLWTNRLPAACFSTVFSEAAALYGGIVSVSYKTVPYNSGRNLTANDVIKKSTRACKCQWFPPER